MKKITALILCVVMCISLLPLGAFAASSSLGFEEELAGDLKALGLFKGVSEHDFALNRAPTRIEALVMLIRVLGKESEALSKGGKHPFLDVPAWADKYVGYAYENKLTNGMSATKFGSSTVASSSMYLTFVLRALGYSDANGQDFTWDNPFTLARTSGIMLGNPDTINFLRADVVLVSYAALEAQVKGTSETLAQKLIRAGAFSAAMYDKYYDVAVFENKDTVHEMTSAEIYEKCSPAVFYIEVYNRKGEAFAFGSGFFIDSDGTAVTNYHVIEGAYSAIIKRSDTGAVYKVLGVYDYNAARDWAVIKVDGKNFPYLEMDDSKVNGGEEIFTIGNPKGLENTISEGLISNPNRNLDGIPFIQISAPISSGSSGGALINKLGKVIGITSAVWKEGQNLNLALPISIIKGYNKTAVHPFSALGSGDDGKPLGNIDLDAYPENERAFELLKMFIYNYQNKTMDWGPGYIEVVDYEDGSQAQYIISYDESNDEICVSVDYYSGEDAILSSLWFEAGEWDVETIFGLYFELYSGEGFWGGSYIPKEDFSEDMVVQFAEYGGDASYYYDCQLIAKEYYLMALSFVEAILTQALSGYDVDGVRALGFEDCYFE